MSFGTYARRVRDDQLPVFRRYSALRCAVGEYAPLGFHATWAYVTAEAHPSANLRGDVPAIVRALDILEASRRVRLAELVTLAALRRAEKSSSRRTPRPDDLAFLRGPQWPGTVPPSQRGLLAAVADRRKWFRVLSAPDACALGSAQASAVLAEHRRLDDCAVRFLAHGGKLSPQDLQAVASAVTSLEQLTQQGYAPVNVDVLPRLRFARLIDYASKALNVR